MAESAIHWTDKVWNFAVGCQHVSPGCDHCYAETLHRRLGAMGQAKYARPFSEVRVFPELIGLPLGWKKPARIFVNSMSDFWHPDVPEWALDVAFAVMADCPRHQFQILTKRPARMRAYLRERLARGWPIYRGERIAWPLPNVWLGVSVESGDYLWRVRQLRDVPAAVRFISAEPLLGPLDGLDLLGVHWVIVGGESGSGHRPMRLDWARGIRDLCRATDTAFFYKQSGGPRPGMDRELDGRMWEEYPA